MHIMLRLDAHVAYCIRSFEIVKLGIVFLHSCSLFELKLHSQS